MKNEQPKNAGQPKTVSVAAGNYMSTDNGMPSSEEMEQAVVLAILTQSTAICEVGNRLRPEMFTNPAYCLVYRAMLALYQHEADIDMLSVEREMRRIDPEHATQLNGLAFIADGMLKVRNARFIKTYAAWVIRCWVLRQAIAGMTARMVEAREPGVDVMAWRIRYDGHFTFVQFPPAGVPKDVPASDGKEPPPAKPAKPRTPPAGRPNYNRFKDKES